MDLSNSHDADIVLDSVAPPPNANDYFTDIALRNEVEDLPQHLSPM